MKKIVLINAVEDNKDKQGPHPPLGLLSIGSYLKKRLPKVYIKILDSQLLSSYQIKEEMRQIKPNFVGLSFVFENYPFALKLARLAKKLGARVLMGGHYASGLAAQIIKNRGINSQDYCLDGVIQEDGEEAFFKCIKGTSPRLIENLIYCQGNRIIKNKIKAMPLPNSFNLLKSHLLDLENYFREYQRRFPSSPFKRPFLVCSQKGCSWRAKTGGCIFCSLMQRDFRLRPPRDIWEEVDKLVDKYGIDYIWDTSDNFLGNKEWFEEFYREFKKRKVTPLFKIYARANDLCDEKTVAMLKNMNVKHVFVGFESNDDRMLTNIKKGTLSRNNEIAIGLLKKYKISILAFLVLGLPGETKNSLIKTVKFAERILRGKNENALDSHMLVPLPNSKSFELIVKKLNKKYTGKDLINWNECACDWIKNFCNVAPKTIIKYLKYLRELPRAPHSFSY